MREQTCGDRHCREGGSYSICEASEEPLAGPAAIGSPLCQWNGTSCRATYCGHNPDDGLEFPACPAGSTCEPTEPEEDHPLICVRSDVEVDDRMRCERDSDCVPEPCCRPTQCVVRSDAVCRTGALCCACRDCRPCIAACRCVDGCCITTFDEDGCC